MASPWTTYTPLPPPTRLVKSSSLSDNSHTVRSEPVTSDASPEMPHVFGRTRPNPSVSSIEPFTSGSHTEGVSKDAPIIVSATSFGVKFQEAGPPTLTSVDFDKRHTSGLFPAPHSPVSSDAEQHVPSGADLAAAHLVESVPPIHEQVVEPRSSSPSSMSERVVRGSSPTKTAQEVAPIPAANNETPSSPRDSATPQRTPTVNLNLTQSPEGRAKPGRQAPKRSITGGTSGTSGSGSIVQSQYVDMVFEEVPRLHNLLSGLCTWMLLAGFVVLPGTFSTLDGIQSKSGEFEKVLTTIHHLPLLYIAFGCCGVGACGMCYLWWRWSHNYVWLLNSIFVPGVLNGLSGVVSSFASIYGAQNGVYGASSIATLAVTGACTVICGFLTAIYSLWKLDKVKRRHIREMSQVKNEGEVHYF